MLLISNVAVALNKINTISLIIKSWVLDHEKMNHKQQLSSPKKHKKQADEV